MISFGALRASIKKPVIIRMKRQIYLIAVFYPCLSWAIRRMDHGKGCPPHTKAQRQRGENVKLKGGEKAVKPPLSHLQKLGLCASRSISSAVRAISCMKRRAYWEACLTLPHVVVKCPNGETGRNSSILFMTVSISSLLSSPLKTATSSMTPLKNEPPL